MLTKLLGFRSASVSWLSPIGLDDVSVGESIFSVIVTFNDNGCFKFHRFEVR